MADNDAFRGYGTATLVGSSYLASLEAIIHHGSRNRDGRINHARYWIGYILPQRTHGIKFTPSHIGAAEIDFTTIT